MSFGITLVGLCEAPNPTQTYNPIFIKTFMKQGK